MNKQLEEKLIIILDNHIDFAEWATSASEQTELLEELSTLINKCEEDAVREFEEYTHRFDGFTGLKAVVESYLSEKGSK